MRVRETGGKVSGERESGREIEREGERGGRGERERDNSLPDDKTTQQNVIEWIQRRIFRQ